MPRPEPPGSGIATTEDERPQATGLASGLISSLLSPGLVAGLIPVLLSPGLAVAVEYVAVAEAFISDMAGGTLEFMDGTDISFLG